MYRQPRTRPVDGNLPAVHDPGLQGTDPGFPPQHAGGTTDQTLAGLFGGETDGWVISYIDVLTLLLTAFVLLLALNRYSDGQTASAAELEPSEEVVATPTAEPPPLLTEAELEPVQPSEYPPDAEPTAPLPAAHTAPPIKKVPEHSPDMADAVEPMAEPRGEMHPKPSAAQEFLAEVRAGPLAERIEASASDDAVNLEISDAILFESGSADLKTGGRDLLDELAEVLGAHAHPISVEGHTDDIPIDTARFPSNWELSTARATMVTRYLIERGLTSERLRAIGYGATRPLASNQTSTGRKRNRRVTLSLQIPPSAPESLPTHSPHPPKSIQAQSSRVRRWRAMSI